MKQEITTVDKTSDGYYRILEGEHAGKVIIKSMVFRIDSMPIILFANAFTWQWVHELAEIKCEPVRPTFSEATNPIDRTQSTWYPDNSDKPMFHTW